MFCSSHLTLLSIVPICLYVIANYRKILPYSYSVLMEILHSGSKIKQCIIKLLWYSSSTRGKPNECY